MVRARVGGNAVKKLEANGKRVVFSLFFRCFFAILLSYFWKRRVNDQTWDDIFGQGAGRGAFFA